MIYLLSIGIILLAIQTVVTVRHYLMYQNDKGTTHVSTPVSAPPVDQVTKEYVDFQVRSTEEALATTLFEVVSDFDRVDEDIADLLNSRKDVNASVKALQELSETILDVINGISQDLEDLKVLAHSTPSQMGAYRQLPTRPTPVAAPVAVPVAVAVPVDATMPMTVPSEEHMTENNEEAVESVPEVPVEPPVEEVQLKAPRADDEPMITDLRAKPFEEFRDEVGNIHDIPAHSADYEVMGAEKRGGRAATPRGFRRI